MNLRLKIAGAVSTIALLATATSAIAQEIRVWTTETQPARLERQQKMAADYEASTGVKVQMIPVEESDYGTRATAAFAAGDLPDVIYYPLSFALPWAEAGILDAEAAQEVLDASLRVEMRLELARLHQTLKTTMVYVTHDQVEAMTLADRIVVLESGKIAQIGTPKQLYEQPANLFVAQFVGSPKMNIISRQVAESVIKNDKFLEVLIKNKQAANIGVRPEHFTLQCIQKKGFLGSVSVIEYLGADCFVFVNCGDLGTINVRVEGSEQYMIDEKVSVNPILEHLHFFDQQGHRL